MNKPKNAELIQKLILLGDIARENNGSLSLKGLSKEESKKALSEFFKNRRKD